MSRAADLSPADLPIAGLARLSTCDWPDKLSVTVFCQGCPWSCSYCHNPALLDPRVPGSIPWADVADLLRHRTGLLDAVVFSGGEPTLHAQLPQAIEAARSQGFSIGLHTSGAFPGRLSALLPRVDWVGLDIKAPRSLYEVVTGSSASAGLAFESLERVIASGIDYEVRTTIDPSVLDGGALETLVEELSAAGVRAFAAQRLVSRDHLTGSLVAAPKPPKAFLATCSSRFESFTYRSGP